MSSLLFPRGAVGRCGSAKSVTCEQDAITGIHTDGIAMCVGYDKGSLNEQRSGRREQPSVSLYDNSKPAVLHTIDAVQQKQRD
jgi:hypothetical protein